MGRPSRYGEVRDQRFGIVLTRSDSAKLRGYADSQGCGISDVLTDWIRGGGFGISSEKPDEDGCLKTRGSAEMVELEGLREKMCGMGAELEVARGWLEVVRELGVGSPTDLLEMVSVVRGESCESCGDLSARLDEASGALEFYTGEEVWGGTPRGPLMLDRKDWRSGERGEAFGGRMASEALGRIREGKVRSGRRQVDVVTDGRRLARERAVVAKATAELPVDERRARAQAVLEGYNSRPKVGFASPPDRQTPSGGSLPPAPVSYPGDLSRRALAPQPKPVRKDKGKR